MKKLIMAIVPFASTLIFNGAAWAGDNGGGRLKCVSDSGHTRIEGAAGVEYNGTGPLQLNYTIDGATVEMTPVVLDSTRHLIDFVAFSYGRTYVAGFRRTSEYVNGDGKSYLYGSNVFQIQSIPGTMKSKSADVFTFRALIPAYTSIDPRKGQWNKEQVELFDKDIEVGCILDITL